MGMLLYGSAGNCEVNIMEDYKDYGNMQYNRLFVTGDTHGERARFQFTDTPFEELALEGDILFVTGDFGYVHNNNANEMNFRRIFLEKKYTTCFVDGNHEGFGVLNSYPVSMWCGGKVHVIEEDDNHVPKLIHLMRGQVFNINGKKIFTMGGAYSMDRNMRIRDKNWWPEEMPNDEEKKEALDNLSKNDNKVDYIITHTTRSKNIVRICPRHQSENEKPINEFLEYIYETVDFKHWYFGHLHKDEDIIEYGSVSEDNKRQETVMWFDVKNMEDNSRVTFLTKPEKSFIFDEKNEEARLIKEKWEKQEEYGRYLVYGKSFSGKSTFLRSIAFKEKVQIFSMEDICVQIVEMIRGNSFGPVFLANVIVIEDMDRMEVMDGTRAEVVNLLNKYRFNNYGQERLIILTGSDNKKFDWYKEHRDISLKALNITEDVVRKMAAIHKVKLSEGDVESLCECADMVELLGMLHKVKAREIIDN